jgi:hypothetical protein
MAFHRISSVLLNVALLAVCVAVEAAGTLPPKQLERDAGYVEWALEASDVAGNPFDLPATVIFTHPASGETRVTEMFFDGADVWRFRFAGDVTGVWSLRTRSPHPDLDGWTGSVRVSPPSAAAADGFVTGRGTRWAWAGTDRVFVPQLVMIGGDDSDAGPALYDEPEEVDALIREFIDWHGFTGFHVNRLAGFWFDSDGGIAVDPEHQDPDPATFAALEGLISRAHAAGAMVHIWAWGDAARGESPAALSGGINGPVDRRLQRYIAARLGPVPGWSMGYGFDLYEWIEADELHAWHDFMQRQLGWPHLLGGRPQAPWSGTDHSGQRHWNAGLGYASYEHHRPSYAVYAAAMQTGLAQPVFSEDRFRVRSEGRDKDYTEADTRRGLWRSTLAGGVANIWGQLATERRVGGTGVYGNRQQIKTYATFFFERDRFRADLRPASRLSDGIALAAPDGTGYIVYREDADRIDVDLSAAGSALPAVAVDTRRGYAELDLGRLAPNGQTLHLPHRSDWAIAIGSLAGPHGAERPWSSGPGATATTAAGSAVVLDVVPASTAQLHGFDPVSHHGGGIELEAEDALRYTPSPDHAGADRFGYTIRHANGAISSAYARITVQPRRADPLLAAAVPLLLGVIVLALALRRRGRT